MSGHRCCCKGCNSKDFFVLLPANNKKQEDMSLYFAWEFSSVQIVAFSLLLLLLFAELLYLYFIYNRVPSYVRKVTMGRVDYVSTLPSVSVVVYAHAEEAEGLFRLLPRLLQQDYPTYEVIVVTDDVSDEACNVVSMYELENKNVYQTHVPDIVYNVSRKKLGITLGIKAAKNDIILLTDAHCLPVSDKWIYAMARNFRPDIDVVLGYTRMVDAENNVRGGFRVFERLTFALRYMAYALMQRPYMGVSGNLAYRRNTFFANNGFSATLQLHYGEDDLLVNEIAQKGNTRVELSPESMVESIHSNVNEAWDELNERYNFTSRYLHTSSKFVFCMESIVHLVWAVVWVLTLVVSGGNMLCCGLSFLMLTVYWVLTWCVYRQAQRVLGERCAVGCVPLYHLLRPCYTLSGLLSGNKHSRRYFTWQHLR